MGHLRELRNRGFDGRSSCTKREWIICVHLNHWHARDRTRHAARIALSLQTLEAALQQKRLDWLVDSDSFQQAKQMAADVLKDKEVNISFDANRPFVSKAEFHAWFLANLSKAVCLVLSLDTPLANLLVGLSCT